LEGAAGVRYGPEGIRTATGSPVLVGYCDDFVVCCHTRQQAEQVKAQLAEWLARRGLAFNDEKTKIVSLEAGFDFLGVRHEAPSIRVEVKDRHRCAVAAA